MIERPNIHRNKALKEEKRENRTDTLSEEISKTDKGYQATDVCKISTNLKQKNEYRENHITVKLMKTKHLFFTYSPQRNSGDISCKEATLRALTDFSNKVMPGNSRMMS